MKSNNEKSSIGGITGKITSQMAHGIRNSYNIGSVICVDKGTKGGIIGGIEANCSISLYYVYYLNNDSTLQFCDSVVEKSVKSKKMIGNFSSYSTTEFNYELDTTEESDYAGDLLTKLNKYVENKGSDYLHWKIDEEHKNPIFIYE